MTMQIVGVVGAGVMGSGVALNLAQTGHDVILVDVSNEILDRARDDIKRNLRFQSFLRKGEQRPSTQSVIDKIQFTVDYRALSDAYFVIENVTEKWEIKKRCYQLLEEVCPAPVVFAADTSAIPITRIASATKRPQQVIGIHFMNPVPLKPTVEVIRGHHTSPATVETTGKLLERMGKQWIIVNDSPGFVSNRVLMLTVNEAVFLLHEQVASVEDIDNIFKGCFGHKMGPLETADLIGLDTILLSLEVLYESFNDSKFRPCPLLRRMVDAGLHGRKSGQGFYNYAVK